MNVLTKFRGKLSILHTLLIHLKRRDSLEKRVRVFAFLRFINLYISRLHRVMCQLEKPPANETTEPLSFTVCELELFAQTVNINVKTGRFCSNCAHNDARTVGIISHNIVVLPKPNNGIYNTQNSQQTCA